jgi:hypothetical protein
MSFYKQSVRFDLPTQKAGLRTRVLIMASVLLFLALQVNVAFAAGQMDIATELSAEEAELILTANPKLVERVFNEYLYFSQCDEILYWDEEGHYTLARNMKLASIPGIIYGSFQVFSWTLSNARRVWNGQRPVLVVDSNVAVPATPPRTRLGKAASIFKRYRTVRGVAALSIGIYLFMHANAIADGDKYEIVAGSLQDFFDGLEGASDIKLREAALTDVMTKGSLTAVSLDLAMLSCGDEKEPPIARSPTHGEFFDSNVEVPLPGKELQGEATEVELTEKYLLTAEKASAQLKANRFEYISVRNRLRELSACSDIWVMDPETGEARRARYARGTYLVGTAVGSVAGYLIITELEARNLRRVTYDTSVKRSGFHVLRNGKKLALTGRQFLAKAGLSVVGSSFIFLQISTFLAPIVMDVLGEEQGDFFMLDRTLQEEFNTLDGASEIAMRKTIINQVRRAGGLSVFSRELDYYHMGKPEGY